ncbi:hypothetical protein VTL71DRAFT_10121, partial [Oculimacula yallundae]
MIVMAIEAARQLSAPFAHQITGYRLENIRFLKAINVNDSDQGTEAQIHMRPRRRATNATAQTWYDWRIFNNSGDEWIECAHGSVKVDLALDEDSPVTQARKARSDESVRKEHHEVMERCSLDVHHDQLYNSMSKFGFDYGPYFRQLRDITYDKTGHASATLSLRGYYDKMPYAGEDPCVIHPTTLDALCHLQMVALSAGGWKPIPTMMFSHLKSLWISQKLFTASGNPLLHATTHETMRGFREAEYTTIALMADTQEPMLVAEGERGTAITSLAMSDQIEDESTARMCYSMDFKPALSLLDMEETQKVLAPLFAKFPPPPKETIDRGDAIAFYYMETVLAQLDKTGTKQLDNHFERYVGWMRRMLEQKNKGLASRGRDDLDIQSVLASAHLEPSQCLVAKVGKSLSNILTGSENALQVIFEGTLADEFYHSDMFTASYKKIGAYIDIMAHANPNLKVLEVGAGTGSSTGQILPFLSYDMGNGKHVNRFSEYAYTDISPGFFERARERFQPHAKYMRFQKLDLEFDPVGQGFEAGTYDVVVAGNVLHATSDLHQTLNFVKKLLKPGGKLIMVETTNLNSIRDALIFGLVPGWWLRPSWWSTSEEYKDQGPLLTEKQWADVLPKCGFNGLDMIFRDHEQEPHHRMSVLVATATEDTPAAAPLAMSTSCFIVADEQSKLQKRTAADLKKRLLADSMASSVDIITVADTVTTVLKGSTVVSLLELEYPSLGRMDDAKFNGVKKIALDSKLILWVNGDSASNPEADLSVGFGRTVCSERGDQGFITLSLEREIEETTDCVDTITRVLRSSMSHPDSWNESEFTQKDGVIQIARIAPMGHLTKTIAARSGQKELETYTLGQQPKPHFNVTIASPGLLDTLYFAEDSNGSDPLKQGDVEIEIKATSVNFKDVMIALGQIPGNGFGFDGAGVVSRCRPDSSFSLGDRVLFFSSAAGGGFGTFVKCSELQTQKIPDSMPFTVAAAISVVYSTVVYSFYYIARLQKGESVLIHAGAGGVGQAAVQIAKIIGAEIFVTVGSESKRQLMKELYGIPASRCFSSRDASFAEDIRQATGGRGVDVILNSLGGDLLQQSWDSIAPFGRFVDIGKTDIINNSSLPMAPFDQNVTFSAVDLVVVQEKSQPLMKQIMTDVMALFEKHPHLHEPRPLHVFPASKIEEAMRFLQGGKNTGKAVIDFETAGVEVQFRPALRHAYSFDEHSTYVIGGGLGGLGRNIVRWMVSRGARNFLLLSRNGASKNLKALKFIKEIELTGSRVLAPPCDITKRQVLVKTLQECGDKLPPIKGCIQAAMVLHDDLFENMTRQVYEEALAPKLLGSWNLHELLPQDMDFFVLLSSFGGVIGNRGQSNYAAGNTYEDALARYRSSKGLKGVSIDLALIVEAGWAVDNYAIITSTLKAGHTAIKLDQLMALLDVVCDPNYDCQRPGAVQVLNVIDSPQKLWRMAQESQCAWLYKPLFGNLLRIGESDQISSGNEETKSSSLVDYLALVKASANVEEAGEIITQGLVEKLAKSLSVPAENLDVRKPAYALGVDSLIAVEVRYWFMKQLNVEVAVFNIMKDQSLVDLCQFVGGLVLI